MTAKKSTQSKKAIGGLGGVRKKKKVAGGFVKAKGKVQKPQKKVEKGPIHLKIKSMIEGVKEEKKRAPNLNEIKSERNEDSGRTKIHDHRLTSRAIRNGWIPGKTRWETDATPDELEQLGEERPLTLKERVALTVSKDVEHNDARVRQIAVRNAIAMESQNQGDQQGPVQNVHLHAHAENPYMNADTDALIDAKLAIERLKLSVKDQGRIIDVQRSE